MAAAAALRICNYPWNSIRKRGRTKGEENASLLSKAVWWIAATLLQDNIKDNSFCVSPLPYLKSNFTGVPPRSEAQSITLSKGRISPLMKGKKILQATGAQRPLEIWAHQHAREQIWNQFITPFISFSKPVRSRDNKFTCLYLPSLLSRSPPPPPPPFFSVFSPLPQLMERRAVDTFQQQKQHQQIKLQGEIIIYHFFIKK